jgi:hypothetical protein
VYSHGSCVWYISNLGNFARGASPGLCCRKEFLG